MGETRKISRKPYLLSTTATLKKAGVLDYDGDDFSWNRDSHRDFTKRTVARVAKDLVKGVIIPNALIMKGAGLKVTKKDAADALVYAMTSRKTKRAAEAWSEFRDVQRKMGTTGWFYMEFNRQLAWYVNDLPYSRKSRSVSSRKMPRKLRMDLNRYVSDELSEGLKRKLRKYEHTNSPSLNRLVAAYGRDRKVASLSARKLMAEFHVTRKTADRFRTWLRQRELSGKGPDFTVITSNRRKTNGLHEDNTAGNAGKDGSRSVAFSGIRPVEGKGDTDSGSGAVG